MEFTEPMGKTLVIAEKPSVGMTIAKALRISDRQKGYIEGDRYIVSWCMGHLLELAPQPVKKEWTFSSLPIIPTDWSYQEKSSEAAKSQLHILLRQIRRKDVSDLVCATDAGREGELIFRIVYNYSGTNKPFRRLWVSSLEEESIREGFLHLKPSKDYDNLYESALARSRADWLVGINGTRLYTIGYGRTLGGGKSELFSVGRVQTPTLNMIVERQKEIDSFKVTKQWAVMKDFGTWRLESVKFKSEEEARMCLDETHEKPVMITEAEVLKKKNSAPKLYSLTTLQQEANRRYGFPAKRTLDIMQGLYEKKMLSYPRTDANYLTSDMEKPFAAITHKLAERLYPSFSYKGCRQVINDSRVSDHYAVIVTSNYARNGDKATFTEDERKILHLVETRMIASISPAYLYEETKVKGDCAGYEFTGSGRREIEPGWRNVERALLGLQASEPPVFPPDLAEGRTYVPVATTLVNRDTKPPRPYTEETLLGAMDRAGTEDMPEDAERKGLGTSASRAGIIERLIDVGYIERKKQKSTTYLVPTDKGISMIAYIDDRLKSPKLTADWEWRLKDIEKGKDREDAFCGDIEKSMRNLVSEETRKLGDDVPDDTADEPEVIGVCPYCGQPFVEDRAVGKCLSKTCGKMIYKDNNRLRGHRITSAELRRLIRGETVEMKLCKKDSPSNWYTAGVRLKKPDELNENEKASRYASFIYDTINGKPVQQKT